MILRDYFAGARNDTFLKEGDNLAGASFKLAPVMRWWFLGDEVWLSIQKQNVFIHTSLTWEPFLKISVRNY